MLAGAHPQITFIHRTHSLSTRHAELLAVLALTASFIGSQLFLFTEQVYARIEKGY